MFRAIRIFALVLVAGAAISLAGCIDYHDYGHDRQRYRSRVVYRDHHRGWSDRHRSFNWWRDNDCDDHGSRRGRFDGRRGRRHR